MSGIDKPSRQKKFPVRDREISVSSALVMIKSACVYLHFPIEPIPHTCPSTHTAPLSKAPLKRVF